ncbi:catalytic LigB subunit of aromatic ring-opening dioxygenase [Sporothrix schenckii 1099-18]|uniref:Catalytic LigB subunit of aromatic ring-opening dioxygenase n=1 Tax=Sporothrix schenckii 1099-18 TaxID=1397361 RepID=A0A0F2LVI1_SPOSC|nr:catalytic LigB subunit of aromatic ring-opening dioxygenase [Sporothrix schenckii 1099-18]KJR81453.1 catalytic LigB subunit of aromatic ring-opening dioxygenase [Sporothrix schenckii 1099-18]
MRLSARVPAILLTAAGATFLAYKAKTQPLFSSFSSSSSSPTLSPTSSPPNMPRAAVVALSHGGGPMPVLGDPSHADISRSLRERVPSILGLNSTERRPKAIVVVTAHWSERVPHISSGAQPKLLYDFGGFPAAAYRLKYDAPGSPAVAQRVAELLAQAGGFAPALDDARGWDHGVFVPLLLAHPAADIPVVQVSVLASEDPAAHFRMGQALAPLRDENVALVGSGFASFHNLRLMFSGITRDPQTAAQLKDWNAAVTAAATEPDAARRAALFEKWRDFPMAYVTHPRGGAEHFLPLIVCAGAAGNEAGKLFTDDFMGLDILSYYWE